MPSQRTRSSFNAIVLDTASDALIEAAAAVSSAAETLAAIESGTLDLDAVTIGGDRFVNNGGILERQL